MCLAALTTDKFEDEFIGWFHNNTNLFWLYALGNIALAFIVHVAASPVAISRKSIDKRLYKKSFTRFLRLTMLQISFS